MGNENEESQRDVTPTLIALRDGDWRQQLSEALGREAFEVATTENGKEALKAITSNSQFRVIIIGDDLDELGGFDVVFRASSHLKNTKTGPMVLFVHSIQHDEQLLEFIQERGVFDWLQFRSPIASVVDQVKICLLDHRRSDARVSENIPVKLSTKPGVEIDARLVDISETGAAIVMRGDADLAVGQTIVIGIPGDDDQMLRCEATVRWRRHKSRFLRSRTQIGAEFALSSEEQREQIARFVRQARIAFEVRFQASTRVTPLG